MSAGDVVQFYAPFVGLMALAFWMGVLSQRVRQLEKAAADGPDLNEKVTRLTVEMEHANATLVKLANQSENTNRQLGNLAMGRLGQGIELPGSKP